MPSVKLKHHSPSPETITSSSFDSVRLLSRETLRISASLASPPDDDLPLLSPPSPDSQFLHSTLRLICCEEIDGRRFKYVAETDGSSGGFKKNSFRAISLHSPQTPFDVCQEVGSFLRSYVVPEGFPGSVNASYVPYMTWRALKHFFGGAMGVFTTQTLLNSVGASRNSSASAAVAINWILKDGAGRVGKMLFARQGKKFDYDLKQLRFAGDLLMELGAGVELATAAVPHLFLPLACAANVVKNVAAVTSTSTRTPIYKAFAKGENIGDVTAKGECVGNIADLMGTGFSILISKRNPSLVTTFGLLSCGYLMSSYQEVRSVVLHTLNRARFTVAVESFLKTGRVPSLQEGNIQEKIFTFPWVDDRPVMLGARFKDAFQDPSTYLAVKPFFDKERYMVTYSPTKGKVYALLKHQANSDDILKAAFHAHVLLHFMNQSKDGIPKLMEQSDPAFAPMEYELESRIAESCEMVSTSYGIFKSRAAEQGWRMSESLLNPGRARLCHVNEGE
ncbi:PREDICTED: protein root UVB sensitive 6 isoform X1 [Camelina sativa]|uniref:Protein root UVB sensitive 6 isoform X1 n=1 Tax=Camelina sativa TaxID=90675 RepID=A0ABM0UKG0_CAMSA|nr:PREDICTED: protein root UVB sensitive 6 isoform X1 [Camelina sativa]